MVRSVFYKLEKLFMAKLLLQKGFMISNPKTIPLAYEAKLKLPMSSRYQFLQLKHF